MSKHTSEPWDKPSLPNFDGFTNMFYCIIRGSNGSVKQKIYGTTQNEAVANADRIVACVNACAGIQDPEKYMKLVRMVMAEGAPSIAAQRDELLEALKRIKDLSTPDTTREAFKYPELVHREINSTIWKLHNTSSGKPNETPPQP